jgi:hypothetical protein
VLLQKAGFGLAGQSYNDHGRQTKGDTIPHLPIHRKSSRYRKQCPNFEANPASRPPFVSSKNSHRSDGGCDS